MKPSKLDITKHKGQVLDLIMHWKREEVPKAMAQTSMAQVRAFAQTAPPTMDFAAAIRAQAGASLIAEVKRASPSRGLIAKDWDPELIAETYARNGAAVISCLTDSRFFQGKLEYLTAIKQRLHTTGHKIPVLRKDFIYHPYQVYEARMAGADAILLIVAVLTDNELQSLHALATELHMQSLVEVHDEDELARALKLGAPIIGVNNRNLKTFDVDINNTRRLRAQIPPEYAVVGESGIRNEEDVRQMAEMGCDAILVGETFCRLPQSARAAKVREFVNAGRTG